MCTDTMTDATTVFENQRRFLKGLAYRMLGSIAEAEDIVQDCWLRWHQVEHAQVRAPKAFLAQTATRLCLDKLRSASHQREQYVGIWLPDPWLEDTSRAPNLLGAEESLGKAQDLGIAFLLVLQRLTPAERAAFLLNEVFDWDFDAIAEVLQRSATACRQLAHRARQRFGSTASPGQGDSWQNFARKRDVARDMAVAVAFANALRSGNIQALADTLAEDVVFMTDGGGKAHAVPYPLEGTQKVAQVLLGFGKQWDHEAGLIKPAIINGMPGAVFMDGQGGIVQTLSIDVNMTARIHGIYVMRNPDKLRHVSL